METTAKVPENPGATQGGKAAGEHIHQLLALARSLVRTAGQAGRAVGEGTHSTNNPVERPALFPTALGLDLESLSDDEAAA